MGSPRPKVPVRKYPTATVGNYSAPVDTSGLGPEWSGILTPAKTPKKKSSNPVGDWFRKTFGGQ